VILTGNGSSDVAIPGGIGGSGSAGRGGGLDIAASTVTLNNDTRSSNNANGGHGGNGSNGFVSIIGRGGSGGPGSGGGLFVAGVHKSRMRSG
jgi:hypothetical protein